MNIRGWIEIETDGNCVLECSPYYDMLEWLAYVHEENESLLEDKWYDDDQ
jgi:hypothetical protein